MLPLELLRGVVADSVSRARTIKRVLYSADEPLDPEIRRQLARTADRVALDLAKVERDLALQGMAA